MGQGCFNPNGCDHKYCDKYKWVLDRAAEYAEALGVTRDEVLCACEENRNYCYMNYYQDCNQPSLKGTQKVIKVADWLKELESRFGEDSEDWKFVCPSCGHVQSVADFKAIGVDGNKAYCECIADIIILMVKLIRRHVNTLSVASSSLTMIPSSPTCSSQSMCLKWQISLITAKRRNNL